MCPHCPRQQHCQNVPSLHFQALRRHVRQADLPLLGSQLLGAAMAAARPAGSSLDVKRSRWRKFGAFLRAVSAGGGGNGAAEEDVLPGVPPAALRGLLVVEEDAARGTALVRAVNREHPVLVAHKPWPASAEAGVQAPGGEAAPGGAGGSASSSGGEAPFLPPILHEWLQPSAAAAAVCSYVAAAALRARRRPLGSVAPVRGMWLAEPSLQHSGAMPEAEPGTPLPQEWRALSRGSAAGRPPPILLTKAQAAAVFSEYVALRDLASLPDRRAIVVDDRLADAIFGAGKDVRSHAAAAAPLSKAQFPSLAPRVPAAGAAAVAPAVEDAWGGAGGEDEEEEEEDGDDEDEEDESAAAGGATGLPSPLDEPPVVPDPRSALPRDDAARLWLQRLSPFYSLTFPAAASDGPGRAGGSGGGCVGGDVVLKRGAPPVVRVYTRKLQASNGGGGVGGGPPIGHDTLLVTRMRHRHHHPRRPPSPLLPLPSGRPQTHDARSRPCAVPPGARARGQGGGAGLCSRGDDGALCDGPWRHGGCAAGARGDGRGEEEAVLQVRGVM